MARHTARDAATGRFTRAGGGGGNRVNIIVQAKDAASGVLRRIGQMWGSALGFIAGRAKDGLKAVGQFALKLATIGSTAISALPLLAPVAVEIGKVGMAGIHAAPALAAFAVAGGVVIGTLKAIFAEGRAMREVLKPLADGIKLAGDNASRAAARGLKPLVKEFNKAVWPEINHMMVQIGNTVNGIAKYFLAWGRSAQGIATIKNILHPIWQAFDDLDGPISRVVMSFTMMLGRIMGVSLAAGTSGLAGALENLADKMDAVNAETVSAGLEKLRSTADTVKGALSRLWEWIGKLADAYKVYQTQFGLVADAIAVVAIAVGGPVAAIAGAVGLVIRHWEELKGAYERVTHYFGSTPWGMSFMANMRTASDTVIPALTAAFNDFKEQAGPALEEVARVIGTRIIPEIGRLVNEAAPKIAEFIGAVSGAVQTVFPKIVEVFGQIKEKVGPAVSNISDTIINELIPAVSKFITAAAPVVAWFVETLGPVVAGIFQNLIAIIDGALKIIIGVVKIFTGILTGDWSQCWEGIKQIIIGAYNILDAITRQIWEGIKMAFKGGIDIVVAIIKTGVDLITAPFRWLYNTLIGNSIIPDLINGIVNWFASLLGKLGSILSGLVTAVVGFFTDMMTRGVTAIRNGITSVGTAVTDVKNAITGKFSDATSWLYDAGKNIIQGLINGIKYMATSAVNAARGVVGDAISGAKNLLGISSPSKVFEQIGAYTSEGFARGIRGGMPGVAAASRDMARMPVATAAPPAVVASTAGAVLELRSSGSRVDDLLVEILRRAVRVRGGNVQTVLGG